MVSKALGKYVQSLHQKKYRHRHGAFLVEGGKSVLELLSSDLETEHLLATAEFADQNRAQLPARLPLTLATEHELTQLGTLATNTTALAVARAFRANSTVMRFNEALHQGQPKAKSAMRARLGSVFLAKAIEDKLQKVRSDTLTSILDTH